MFAYLFQRSLDDSLNPMNLNGTANSSTSPGLSHGLVTSTCSRRNYFMEINSFFKLRLSAVVVLRYCSVTKNVYSLEQSFCTHVVDLRM